MKIGIFTFFQTNYGAVLQAYALQRYLQDLPNTDVEIVDFTTPVHLKGHEIFKKYPGRNPFHFLLYYSLTFIYRKQLKRRVERTWDFKGSYYHFTKRYSSVEELLTDVPPKDIYITGSDQVFNSASQYMPVFYLGFDKGRGKKVAYAPSFGISKFDTKMTAKISKYVKDFDFLSCREQSGADYLGSIVGYNVPVVIDPVFLHDSNAWNNIAVCPKYKKNYIFIYDLNGGYNLVKIAKKIQKKNHLPIVCLTGNRLNIYPVSKQFYDAGPAEFIGWIKNASFVVTDSFHGTAFSLIYKKNFFTYIAIEETSDRIKDLLSEAGLACRIVRNIDLKDFEYTNCDIIPMPQLDDFIIKSKAYLNSSLS